jgi:hypothetical protein
VDVDDKKQARRRLQQQQQKILLDTAIGQSTSSNDIISQHRQLMLEKSRFKDCLQQSKSKTIGLLIISQSASLFFVC